MPQSLPLPYELLVVMLQLLRDGTGSVNNLALVNTTLRSVAVTSRALLGPALQVLYERLTISASRTNGSGPGGARAI